jgi:hypothetical protein
MRRVPGIGLLFDGTDFLRERDRKIMKMLVKAAEQNCDSNRRLHVTHFRILICNIRNYVENYIMRSLMNCTPYPILCGW